MRQEAEGQAAELSKRQARVRESPVPENVAKWQAAEAKMQELKANMAVLGKEASAALAAVEAQQQRLTFQRLVSLVVTSSNCFEVLFVNAIDFHSQMVSDKQQRDSAPPVIPTSVTPSQTGSEKTTYFLAEATHSFHAETDKELSLAIGDFRRNYYVMAGGWSEGECKGKSGWFQSAFVERRQRIPTAN
ncbi:SH3 domain-containing protein 3 [Linum grandiflorum]